MMTFGRAQRFDSLFRTAEEQSGFFTAEQASASGYSQRLLSHHARHQHITRMGRGIYRLVHFPQLTDAEDLVVHWLWSQRQGVFSHTTALQLHQLSDAMPERATMTLPESWSKRRLRVPADLRLRFAELASSEWDFVRGVPVTKPARTVNDCALSFVEPDLVGQAVREGLERELFVEEDIAPARAYMLEQGA